ncbi:hypothetical protein TELCIR_04306 [Teladorsagia circumcincta]|uniref:EF-hand domain-containing protein n=1 Tax=Teladorsagia circumcincta TaxID=45464 RepID=A0A2G9UU01_TELCI|nr:hypothetical protein TELCIR_04306 [Teladorsagia circumcincta]
MLEVDGEPGELFRAIFKEQFGRLRNSDRFWFENRLNGLFTSEEIERIHNITLKDIIRETIGISDQWLQGNVFVFGEDDPCPQPFQANITGLETCTPLMRFDHVTEVEGNEITFIFTLIGLGCIPLFCLCIGCVLIQRRRRMGWDSSFDNISVTAADRQSENDRFHFNVCLCIGCVLIQRRRRMGWDSSFDNISVTAADRQSENDRFHFNALEWLQESYVRQVIVELSPEALTLRKPRGAILRKTLFPKAIEVLRLPSDKRLTEFLASLTRIVEKLDGKLTSVSMKNELLLENAETKDRRQEHLDQFFREAYARAFHQPDLCDSEIQDDDPDDVLNQTITRHEFAQAMGMREADMFVQRMFAITARSGSDVITFAEFLEVLRKFSGGQKPAFVFGCWRSRQHQCSAWYRQALTY